VSANRSYPDDALSCDPDGKWIDELEMFDKEDENQAHDFVKANLERTLGRKLPPPQLSDASAAKLRQRVREE
jgi:hypothetical protein